MSSCDAITRKGNQCSKRPDYTGYCWQHRTTHIDTPGRIGQNNPSIIPNSRQGNTAITNENLESSYTMTLASSGGPFALSGNINISGMIDISTANRIVNSVTSMLTSVSNSIIAENINSNLNGVNYFNTTAISNNYRKKINQLKELKMIPLSPNEACGICLEHCTIEKKVTTSCCRRIFCDGCLVKTLEIKNCCPLCRQENFV
jgi:hypothetical protein